MGDDSITLMFDVTQLRDLFTCTHDPLYAPHGVGMCLGAISSLSLHTWLMLRNRWGGVISSLNLHEFAHMVDATQQMVGSNIIVELTHMVDGTQQIGGSNIYHC